MQQDVEKKEFAFCPETMIEVSPAPPLPSLSRFPAQEKRTFQEIVAANESAQENEMEKPTAKEDKDVPMNSNLQTGGQARLMFEGRYLTQEQEDIVRYQSHPGEKIVINAFAGCGKTTTMRALVDYMSKHLPSGEDRKILYVVYNVDMEKSAKDSFGVENDQDMNERVKVCTYHSLALAFFRESVEKKGIVLEEDTVYRFNERGPPFELHYDVNRDLIDTLERFCRDPSIEHMEPQAKHAIPGLEDKGIILTDESLTKKQLYSLREARRLWHDAINLRRKGTRTDIETGQEEAFVQLTHDITLKYFTLHAQDAVDYVTERYCIMLVDEAQDVQRPLMAWLLDQMNEIPIYLVGDTYQSIYAFTGANDAVERASKHPQARLFRLTKSFRFGSRIAQSSTALLHETFVLGKDIHITGTDEHRGCGTVHQLTRNAIPEMAHKIVEAIHSVTGTKDIAFLARANNPALTAAITLYKHAYHVRLAGHMLNLVKKALNVLNKYKNKHQIIERLLNFQRFEQEMEKEQLVHYRNGLEGKGTPLPGKAAYSSEGFQRGRFFLTEEQSFERAVLTKAVDSFQTTHDMFRGLYEQSIAKTVPDDVVCVTVCTIHASKGREWDTVVLVDDYPELDLCYRACRGEFTFDDFNDWKSQKHKENNYQATYRSLTRFYQNQDAVPLRQELHLYYVAMTRAKYNLFMNAPAGKVVNSSSCSNLQNSIPILEISPEALQRACRMRGVEPPSKSSNDCGMKRKHS